jgi:hypothetical protein
MADSESFWIDRAQSAEAREKTLRDQIEPLKERVRSACEMLGARIKGDGSAEIDFEKLVDNLGPENAIQLRAVIDEKYRISGGSGEKPRIKVKSG